MATSYQSIFNVFLHKIREYSYLLSADEEIEEDLILFLNTSCYKFEDVCEKDLSKRDNDNKLFDEDLSYEEIDIITDGMVVVWLQPKVLDSEGMKNVLNTKDITQYSPAKLIDALVNVYELFDERYENGIKDYSYRHGDKGDLHL